jgi:hypothetical protein
MDIRFETRNVRSICRVGSLKTVASELAKYNLDLVSVQDVRYVECDSQPANAYTFLYRNGNDKSRDSSVGIALGYGLGF